MSVSADDRDDLLKPEFWPTGIVVEKFFNFNNRATAGFNSNVFNTAHNGFDNSSNAADIGSDNNNPNESQINSVVSNVADIGSDNDSDIDTAN